jgi:hypothetical protein
MWCKENLIDFQITHIREMLAWAGHEPWPSMPVGRPAQASTNIGRLDTSHSKPGPAAVRRNTNVACVQQGAWSERWYSYVWNVMWGFVLTKSVSRIITKRPTYKSSIRPSSVQTAEALTTM